MWHKEVKNIKVFRENSLFKGRGDALFMGSNFFWGNLGGLTFFIGKFRGVKLFSKEILDVGRTFYHNKCTKIT